MKRYLCFCSQKLTAQNKLEKDYYKLIDSIDRTVVSANDLQMFQAEIINQVADLNKSFPRCKPITIHFWNNASYDGDLHMSDDHRRVSFTLLAINDDKYDQWGC